MGEVVNVIIHGFSGDSSDVDYLRQYLGERGQKAYCIALAGHGGTKQQLHASSHADWVTSAQREISRLAQDYDTVNIVGFSMGGLIGISLCAGFKTGKVVLVNTPVYFWNARAAAKRIAGYILSGGREHADYYRKNAARASTKSGMDFVRVLFDCLRTMKSANHHCIILQCTGDEVIHHKSADYLKRRLGENAILRYYEGGCHKIFAQQDSLRDSLCEDILKFITELPSEN